MHISKQLNRFFTLPPSVDPQIARHFPRNFTVNAIDGVLWLLGESFVSISTILPVYASTLTDSALIIGLIPALNDVGWFFPQVFMAAFVERLPRKLPVVRVLGGIERLPLLFLALAALWLADAPQWLGVGILLLLMIWKGFISGIVALPWQEMIATIIPVSHRGRFFGYSFFAGQLLGVGGAALVTQILARLPYPHNYALTFFLGFLSFGLSWVFLVMTVEPQTAPAPRPQPTERRRMDFARLGGILRENANFRYFLVSRCLAYMSGMATGFLAVYGIRRFELPDAQAGVLTALLFMSGVIGYALWGRAGDRFGHKVVLELSSALWLAMLLVALLAPNVAVFYVTFLLMGLSRSGSMLGDLNIAMEFGPEAERPSYIGLARTIPGGFMFVAPLVGGLLVEWMGYPAMFLIALAFAAAGLGLLRLRVVEPRRAQPRAEAVPLAQDGP